MPPAEKYVKYKENLYIKYRQAIKNHIMSFVLTKEEKNLI